MNPWLFSLEIWAVASESDTLFFSSTENLAPNCKYSAWNWFEMSSNTTFLVLNESLDSWKWPEWSLNLNPSHFNITSPAFYSFDQDFSSLFFFIYWSNGSFLRRLKTPFCWRMARRASNCHKNLQTFPFGLEVWGHRVFMFGILLFFTKAE